jgi:hypothetical protein
MKLFSAIKALFQAPQFKAGEQVNLVHLGAVTLFDGVVLGQEGQTVWVEWPKGGLSRESATALCAIG